MQTSPDTATESLDPVRQAEARALEAEQAEARAEQQFDEARAALAAAGRSHEATQRPEFRGWMDARARTDEAWGRWAMAMDARTTG